MGFISFQVFLAVMLLWVRVKALKQIQTKPQHWKDNFPTCTVLSTISFQQKILMYKFLVIRLSNPNRWHQRFVADWFSRRLRSWISTGLEMAKAVASRRWLLPSPTSFWPWPQDAAISPEAAENKRRGQRIRRKNPLGDFLWKGCPVRWFCLDVETSTYFDMTRFQDLWFWDWTLEDEIVRYNIV